MRQTSSGANSWLGANGISFSYLLPRRGAAAKGNAEAEHRRTVAVAREEQQQVAAALEAEHKAALAAATAGSCKYGVLAGAAGGTYGCI